MRSYFGIVLLSVSVCVGLSGCGGGSDGETRTFDPKKDASHDAEHGHVHGHAHDHGPNGGCLIELGEEEFHAEALFDEKDHKVVLFILDGEAKKAVAIAFYFGHEERTLTDKEVDAVMEKLAGVFEKEAGAVIRK